MDVNDMIGGIGESVFFKFLDLYEQDELTLQNINQFKGTPLFLYVYNYIVTRDSLDYLVEEWLKRKDEEEFDYDE